MRSVTFVSNDFGGLEEEAAMLEVHQLPLQTVLHHIHEGQLVSQVLSGRMEVVAMVTCVKQSKGNASITVVLPVAGC